MANKKYFDKTVPPACAYCRHSRVLLGGGELFCVKRASVDPYDSCRSYRYDVLKRVPAVKGIGRDYKDGDFEL